MLPTRDPEIAALLERLRDETRRVLGDRLVGLYLHGSLVTGDFDRHRSDLDLLAVLSDEVSEEDAERLGQMHARLVEDHPAWQGRIEVAYVPAPALRTFRTRPGRMARISPGEALHLTEAGRHHLLTWDAARQEGVPLVGPPPGEVIPQITRAEFVAVVREHAASWRGWVEDMRHPGGQAYAVLTLCRALYSSAHGGQLSKRAAGRWAQERLPEWGALIGWALEWWYEGGTQTPDMDRFPETRRFVHDVSDRIASTT